MADNWSVFSLARRTRSVDRRVYDLKTRNNKADLFLRNQIYDELAAVGHRSCRPVIIIHCKKNSITHGYFVASFGIMKCRPTLQCGPGLHYSVDLPIQTYAEPVQLKYGKLAVDIRIFFYSVSASVAQ